MNKNVLLICGIVLVAIGLFKPNLGNLGNLNVKPSITLSAPTDTNIKKEAQDVVDFMRKSNSSSVSVDAAQLRDLYINLASMISLSGNDVVINTTEEIRRANSISGHLLQASGVDLKGKYAELAKECGEVIVTSIGEDNVTLSPDLRKKASDGFMALAWAFNQLVN